MEHQPEIAVGESILIDENLDARDALRTFFLVADERGHPAHSVLVDETQKVLTHPSYADRMGYFGTAANAWVFCREPRAELLGQVGGTDWIRSHAMHLLFAPGSPFQSVPHFHTQPYVQEEARQAVPLLPVCSAEPPAWNHGGTHIAVLESRLGSLSHSQSIDSHILWEYDLIFGDRRRVASFPSSFGLGVVQLSYSPADDWLLINDHSSGRNFIVRCEDGLRVQLPVISQAIDWNAALGPGTLTVMTPIADPPGLQIFDFDLATTTLTPRTTIASPSGEPTRARELSVDRSGRRGLVLAPIGASARQLKLRGGVMVAAVIDLDSGSCEQVLPVSFKTKGAERRHNSPRWCDQPVRSARGAVVGDSLLSTGVVHPGDGPEAHDSIVANYVDRWTEIVDGLEQAWETKRLSPQALTAECAQFVAAVSSISSSKMEPYIQRFSERAYSSITYRNVLRLLELTIRSKLLTSIDFPQAESHDLATAPPSAAGLYPAIAASLMSLLRATNLGEAFFAAQVLTAWSWPGEPVWSRLASMNEEALAREDYDLPLQVASAVWLWREITSEYADQMLPSGLPLCEDALALPLLLAGLIASLHVPAGTVVAENPSFVFETTDMGQKFQHALASMDLEDYLQQKGTPDRWWQRLVERKKMRSVTDLGRSEMVQPRLFLSYVREDSERVTRLEGDLQAAGFATWRDTRELLGGDSWQAVLRKAIRDGHYFIACFSSHLNTREVSYMYEELRVAVDQFRRMPPGRRWLIPLKFDPCQVPSFDLGAGHLLDEHIQHIEMYPDWNNGFELLCRALRVGSDLTKLSNVTAPNWGVDRE